MKNKIILTLIAAGALTITSCKKSAIPDATPVPTPTPPTTNPTAAVRADLTRDSIFFYAKEIYLWNSSIPTYEVFNPKKYNTFSTPLDNYETELFEITKFSNPFEYKPGATSSKFSYISDKADQNPSAAIKTASVDTEGNGNDIGIRFGFYGTSANFIIYATAIYEGSPAQTAGFSRGDRITKINGLAYGTNFNSQINEISTAIDASSVILEGFKSDGSAFTKTLTKAVFKSSPVYKTSTITAGSKKIGYLAYARFSNAENSVAALNSAFDKFAADQVTDLIIDLRYNGGGYVGTAEHLINLIAPTSVNGRVMFSEHFNATMQSGNAKILANQPLLDANDKPRYQNGRMLTYADVDYSVAENTSLFAKKGTLTNIQNVVFIVGGGTASASELVINSLKPHINVKLVGLTTYGKPVGFFPVTIENKYDVFYSMFETKNSANVGGYYDGFKPEYELSEVPTNTIMYDFGNLNDNYLKTAISVLAPGVTPTGEAKIRTTVMSVAERKNLAVPTTDVISGTVQGNEFNGMIEDRWTRKKIK